MAADDWQNLVIIGAGWHGKELYSYIRDMIAQGAKLKVIGFIDAHKLRGPFGATEVLGRFEELSALLKNYDNSLVHYITATGNNQVRREFVARLESLGARNLAPWTLRHPRAFVGQDVEIGEGTCLAPGSILTTNVRLGKHCIVNVNASISHDCQIGEHTNINPGAVIAGNVKIGEACFIGAGATIIDKLSIGDGAIIGAGAVVIKDVPPRVTVVGVPARIIKHHGE